MTAATPVFSLRRLVSLCSASALLSLAPGFFPPLNQPHL